MQATLKGYTAWVVERLTSKKGQTPADIANYIFERWVDDNQAYLSQFEITLEHFDIAEGERSGRVLHMPNATSDRADE